MSYNQLTENERYQIYALKKARHSQKEIAKLMSRSPSTICRELMRNKGLRGYRPKQAQQLSDTRRKGGYKARKVTDDIKTSIEALIRQELSPQQVVSYLVRHRSLTLHHETVYQLIYADKANGGDLYTHLRVASKPYRKRYGSYDRRGKIKNRVSIDERPAVVDRGTRIGDWEGDTVIGKGRKSALLTMVERKTLYTVMVRLTGKRAELLAEAAVLNMQHLKDRVKTITFDNGLEFAVHEAIAKGLVRQYFPKGTDFNQVSDTQIEYVLSRLNNRPRATRGNRSPNELYMGQREDLLAA
ncbi:MAG: IS30 family transposase [Candidatus Thiodiazotropha sp. (ex. Lucinoma kazani)]